jgi:hypothetical protein
MEIVIDAVIGADRLRHHPIGQQGEGGIRLIDGDGNAGRGRGDRRKAGEADTAEVRVSARRVELIWRRGLPQHLAVPVAHGVAHVVETAAAGRPTGRNLIHRADGQAAESPACRGAGTRRRLQRIAVQAPRSSSPRAGGRESRTAIVQHDRRTTECLEPEDAVKPGRIGELRITGQAMLVEPAAIEPVCQRGVVQALPVRYGSAGTEIEQIVVGAEAEFAVGRDLQCRSADRPKDVVLDQLIRCRALHQDARRVGLVNGIADDPSAIRGKQYPLTAVLIDEIPFDVRAEEE